MKPTIPPTPSHRFLSKEFLIGTRKSFRTDDILGLFSWIFVGHSLFFLVGTTTFVSTLVFLSNSLDFQGIPFSSHLTSECVAKKVSEYLTRETGYAITFETALVPQWLTPTLRLHNVKITMNAETWQEYRRNNHPDSSFDPAQVDINWTYHTLHVEHLDVTLSLLQYLDGRGILTQVKATSVSGTVNRDHITWEDDWVPVKRTPLIGDFELERFVVEDMREKGKQDYFLSVFHGECKGLRQQWLFYDIIRAESIVGMFDECLFSIHKPHSSEILSQTPSTRTSVFKIAGIPISHINANVTGPFGWIKRGVVDLNVEFEIPVFEKESVIQIVKEDLRDLRTRAVDRIVDLLMPNEYHSSISRDEQDRVEQDTTDQEPASPQIKMIWHVKLKDLKAQIPLHSEDLSFLSGAMMWPVIAYMNANKTLIPITFSASVDLRNFNGSWTIYDSGMVDILSVEIGKALLVISMDEKERNRRLRRIGMWSLQSFTKNWLGVIDYVYLYNPVNVNGVSLNLDMIC